MESTSNRHRQSRDLINISFSKLVRILLSRWYWIAGSLLFFWVAYYLFIQSTLPRYQSDALLKSSDSRESEIGNLGEIVGGRSHKNEEIIAQSFYLKSFSAISATLESMQLRFNFYHKEQLRTVNIYPEKPFNSDVVYYNPDDYQGGRFNLKGKNGSYTLEYVTGDKKLPLSTTPGDTIKVEGLQFVITSPISTNYTEGVFFTYADYYFITNSLATALTVDQPQKFVPVIKLSFTSNNRLFTRDFLRALLNTYSEIDLQEKRKSSDQTLQFINDQLERFEQLLRTSSSKLEGYKKQYDFINIESSSQELMQSLSTLQQQKYMLEIQRENINTLSNDLQGNKEILSGTPGIDNSSDEVLVKLIDELNNSTLQRRQLLLNYSPNSTIVKNVDDDIANAKARIIENIKTQRQRINQNIEVINRQIRDINTKIGTIPTAEKDLLYLTSDVDVNKNIYSLLLNKKLETSISKAGVLPSLARIDDPRVSYQTYPNSMLYLIIFTALGLGFGVGFLFLKRIMNNKFTSLEKLNALPRVSVLGVINHFLANGNKADINNLEDLLNSRSIFSETVNAIRTNLAYLTNNGSKKVIALTSEISGEGKSFSSLNIAISLTKLDKKVVIIASDLRKSKLHRYINSPNRVGLSSYLSDENYPLDEIIAQSDIPKLDVITSGPVPINPSELLYQNRFWNLIERLKEVYDFVIIDTAPIGLVSDSIPIIRKADINIFILRWQYSGQDAYELPARIAEEYDLNNVYAIVNDYKKDAFYSSIVADSGSVYGGYSKYYANYSGYYNDYLEDNPGLWGKIKRFFTKK